MEGEVKGGKEEMARCRVRREGGKGSREGKQRKKGSRGARSEDSFCWIREGDKARKERG